MCRISKAELDILQNENSKCENVNWRARNVQAEGIRHRTIFFLAGVAGSVAQTVLGFVFFVMLRIYITKNTSCGTRLVSSATPSLWISYFAVANMDILLGQWRHGV